MRQLRTEETVKLYQIAASKKKAKLNTCIYARKSREDKSNTSLDTQIDRCKSFINEHNTLLSLNDEAIFQEDNVSGMYLDNRKAFQTMMQAIEKGTYDVVLVSSFDRISRDSLNLSTILSDLENQDVYLIAGDDFGDNSAAGTLIKQIYWATNEFHVRRSVESVMKTHEHLVKAGKTVGGPGNYGYKIENRKYVIEPTEALAVSLIFDYFLEGMSYSQIADTLEKKGFTPRKAKRFSPSFIHSVLTNRRNCGVSVWNSKDKRRIGKRILKETFDEVISEEVVESAIVSKEKFNLVQERLKTSSFGRSNQRKSPYLITGLITCSECGGALTGNSQKCGRNKTLYRTYHCKNHKKKHGKTCKTKPIRVEYLEKTIKDTTLSTVNQIIQDYPIDESKIKYFTKDRNLRLTRIRKELTKLEAQQEKLTIGYHETTSEPLKNQTMKLIDENSLKIERLKSEEVEVKTLIESLNNNLKSFQNGNLDLDNLFLDTNLAKSLIHTMIKEIKVNNSTIEIELND